MGTERVLILGNGISRLLFDAEIRAWDGELWGCNRIFTEYGSLLTRVSGHRECLREAKLYRDQHDCHYEIWAGHLGAGEEGFQLFTCPAEFRRDTGTTLVAQALEERRRRILCCGFDLGGKDVHSQGLEQQDKSCWVRRWRTLARYYGLDNVTFLGHDHKAFIASDQPHNRYMQCYTRNIPHIPDEDYQELFWRFTGKKKVSPRGRLRCRCKDGQERVYWEDLAKTLEERGEVEILGPEEEQSG